MKANFFLVMICTLFCTLSSPLIATSTPKGPEVVILLGAPASGKGTQAAKLSKDLGIPNISTGDLFRDNSEKKTELGKKAKTFMDAGKLVPDDLVNEMLFDRISKSDASQGYILDGFPRTIPQAQALEKKLPSNATVIVLNLVVSDQTIIKRALARKRSDDTAEVIQERLKNYYAQTAPLVQFYSRKGLVRNIDGEKSTEAVFQELKDSIPVQK